VSGLASELLERLRKQRKQLLVQLRAITEPAAEENRNLAEAEQATFQRLNDQLNGLDARIGDLAEQEKRVGGADDQFQRLHAQAPVHASLSAADRDLDAAFRSAIKAKNPAPIEIPVSSRTYYQPGVEQRDLLKTTATQALPTSVYDRIVAHMVENSAVLRAGATVVNTTTGEDLQVPKSTAFSTSALIAEGASITESDPTLAVVTLKAYKYATYFEVSHELANDTSTDLLGFLARQAGESLALAYGDKLINGTGTNEPRGVLTDATAGVSGVTGTGTSLGTQGTAGQGTDILYGLHGSLAEPYAISSSRAWVMRNASLTVIRKLKDTTGQPVLPADGNSFLGAPFVVDPFMPAMANLAESIAYGDWSRYFVRIAEGLRFERSNDFRFQNDLVAFRAVIRIDGALVDVNAIKTFANAT
jgi:HK97 family phage major capsid protein